MDLSGGLGRPPRQLFGRCETKSGIAPTDRLIGEVMSQPPYPSANRLFWIMDNCSAHRERSSPRMTSPALPSCSSGS